MSKKNRLFRKKKRKKERKGKTRHHILASSIGGSDCQYNIKMLSDVKHKALHTLFSNLSPDETLEYLIDDIWKGQYEWLEIFLNRKGYIFTKSE